VHWVGLGVWAYVLPVDGAPIFLYGPRFLCFLRLPSGLGLFRIALYPTTFDLVVVLGVIPVAAAAVERVVVFACGRRINSRFYTPCTLGGTSPW